MAFRLAFAADRPDIFPEVVRASALISLENIVMLPRNIRFYFFGSIAVTALIAVATAAMAAPVRSTPVTQEVSKATSAATDISAARRRHIPRRGNRIPSYGGSYPGFGYGIHDNSGPRSSG
jgi:hypothetical protein